MYDNAVGLDTGCVYVRDRQLMFFYFDYGDYVDYVDYVDVIEL